MADRNIDNKVCENLSFAAKEAFKRLRNNIERAFDPDMGCPNIGVTSAQPSEGKSTISSNLAYSLAEHGHKVLLIDADMRRPSIHTKLGIKANPGLSTLLSKSNDISSCIQTYKSLTGSTSFDVISAGEPPENPSELLDSKRMNSLLDALSKQYSFVLLDLPPVGAVVDAIAISKKTDGMIVVLRENNCPRGVFNDCIDQLEHADANILGFVINGALEGAGKSYQYKY